MPHTSLVPGVGFVKFTDNETALIPGIGFVEADGADGTVPAEVTITGGFGIPVGWSAPSVTAKSTVTIGTISGAPAGSSVPTYDTSNIQNAVRPGFAHVGAYGFGSVTTTRTLSVGFSAEPTIGVASGTTVKNAVNHGAWYVGSSGVGNVTKAVAIDGAAYVGVNYKSGHVVEIDGLKRVFADGACYVGSNSFGWSLANKMGHFYAHNGALASGTYVVTQAGTGGGGTVNVQEVVDAIWERLNTDPPPGMTQETALQVLLQEILPGISLKKWGIADLSASAGNDNRPARNLQPGEEAFYTDMVDGNRVRIIYTIDDKGARKIISIDLDD